MSELLSHFTPMGRGRWRSWWPLWAAAGAVVAVCWLLYVVWQSPHRGDLATYGAFALPVVVLAAGWITWAWRRARTSPADSAADGENIVRVTDRLAAAVQAQWEEAAGKRGLAGTDPLRVTWGRPSLPMTGPLAAAVGSRRFDKPVDGGYEVTGDFTMHGVTKPVTLTLKGGRTAEFPKGVQRTGYSTDLTIKRPDYGMDKFKEGVGDEVFISISFEGTKK